MQKEGDSEEVLNEFQKTEGHAKRAIYDASEATVLFYLEKAFKFQENFGSSPHITDVIPGYINLQKSLHSAQQQINELREDDSAYNHRDEFYEKCEPQKMVSGLAFCLFNTIVINDRRTRN